jgi:hypothetical protein
VREEPEPLAVPQAINQVWSRDFMHDKLEDAMNLRLFNVIDNFNRKALGIEVDFSLPSKRVIRCDNLAENISGTIQTWAKEWGIRFEHIQPDNPQQWLGKKLDVIGWQGDLSQVAAALSKLSGEPVKAKLAMPIFMRRLFLNDLHHMFLY